MGLAPRRAGRFILRLLTAALLAAVVVGLGFAGFLMGTLPRPLALTFEPLSLLLLPGILPALLVAGSHDFAPDIVLAFAETFYAVVFYWALGRSSRRSNEDVSQGSSAL